MQKPLLYIVWHMEHPFFFINFSCLVCPSAPLPDTGLLWEGMPFINWRWLTFPQPEHNE